MRDYLCNEVDLMEMINFYSSGIESRIKKIALLEEDIKAGVQRFPAPPEKVIKKTTSTICMFAREFFTAKYSSGECCENVEKCYKESVKYALLVGYDDFGYVNMLHYMTAGILFEISKEEMQKLIDLIDEAKVDDLLFDYFVNAYGLERKIKSTKYQKKKPYSRIMEIIETAKNDKNAASEMLADYVEKVWLKGHADYGWTTMHRGPDYCGLWSFEAGALAKIFGLDDERIKENNHYPYDLVHYKNGMNFGDVNRDYSAKEETVSYIEGIPEDPSLEAIIPKKYHQVANQLIVDYKTLEDEVFWKKYELDQVWFDLEEFSEDKKEGLLGTLLLFELVNQGYILQLDYKEDLEDYIDDIENYWGDEDTKLITFEIDNDQAYYARVPKITSLADMYEVKVAEV